MCHLFFLQMLYFLLYFQIVVPTLHLGLGIFKSIYDKLEADCHDLDSLIYRALLKTQEIPTDDNNFYQSITDQVARTASTRRKIEEKKEELEEIVDDLPSQLMSYSLHNDKPFELNFSEDILDLLEKKNKLETSIESLVSPNCST